MKDDEETTLAEDTNPAPPEPPKLPPPPRKPEEKPEQMIDCVVSKKRGIFVFKGRQYKYGDELSVPPHIFTLYEGTNLETPENFKADEATPEK